LVYSPRVTVQRRLALRAVVGLALAAAVVVSGIAAAQGDAPTNTGWWSQDPTAAEQDGGGFQVSGIAGQPVSVAALRFSTPSGTTRATLTLTEADGGFVTPATSVVVCKTTDPWQPANPGAYDEAPTPDCTTSAPLARDAEALTWTADVAPLLLSLGGEVSLMIVPGATGGGGSPLDPAFQVTFSGADLAVVSAPGTTLAPSTTTTLGNLGGGGGSGSSFTPPRATPPTTAAAPAITPDTAPADNTPAGGDAFQPPPLAGGATPGSGGSDQPWERLFFLVPLSALLGVAFVYVRRILQQRGVLEEA
jgi:hypothetical protein